MSVVNFAAGSRSQYSGILTSFRCSLAMHAAGGKQYDQEQSSRFDKKVHSSIYCDAI